MPKRTVALLVALALLSCAPGPEPDAELSDSPPPSTTLAAPAPTVPPELPRSPEVAPEPPEAPIPPVLPNSVAEGRLWGTQSVEPLSEVGGDESPGSVGTAGQGPTAYESAAWVQQDGGLDWAALRACENGGSYDSYPGDYYRGAYQFDPGTWASIGGEGDPADASPEEQDARAQALYDREGATPWPRCGSLL